MPLDSSSEHWARLWAKSANNPRLFVTELLKAQPEPWQAEALDAISNHDRVSIRAGHGVGKTTYEAWVTLWFIFTRVPHRVLVTANSQDQLRDTIWPEIRRWAEQLPKPLYERLEFQADHIFLKGVGGSFVTARTASRDNPTALQGLHDENMLLVLAEAPGIPDIVFELGLGTMSTPGAKMLMAGNPSETGGFFYDTHHGLRSRWYTMRVSCEDVPRAKGHIDDVVAKYGRDSNAYRVRVLGEFPDTQDDAVIPLALCEAATRREVGVTDFYPVWGVDVARFGSDRTALAKRRGNTLLEPIKSWRGKETMQVAGLILDEYRRTKDDNGKTTEDTPSEILIDVI